MKIVNSNAKSVSIFYHQVGMWYNTRVNNNLFCECYKNYTIESLGNRYCSFIHLLMYFHIARKHTPVINASYPASCCLLLSKEYPCPFSSTPGMITYKQYVFKVVGQKY